MLIKERFNKYNMIENHANFEIDLNKQLGKAENGIVCEGFYRKKKVAIKRVSKNCNIFFI